MKPRLSPPASHCVRRPALALILAIGLGSAGVFGQDPVAAPALGATAQALIEHARQGNPGFAAARAEASAARERVTPAGALPDPTSITHPEFPHASHPIGCRDRPDRR